MRVLVTRPAGSWPDLARRFAGSGVDIEFAATTMQIEPIDPGPGDAALDRLAACSWIVVTSGHGVRALEFKLAARGETLPSGLRAAAVGPATAGALEGMGVPADLISDDARGEGLAHRLVPHLGPTDRVLVVHPEGHPSTILVPALRATGARVDEAPLYRTVASPESSRLTRAAIVGRYGAVVLTAPSGLTLWLASAGPERTALREALSRVKRVAIGPTTAAALAVEGIPPDEVAERPDAAMIGDAIARALAASGDAPAKMPPPRGGTS